MLSILRDGGVSDDYRVDVTENMLNRNFTADASISEKDKSLAQARLSGALVRLSVAEN